MLVLLLGFASSQVRSLTRYRPAVSSLFQHLLMQEGLSDPELLPALSLVLTELLFANSHRRSVCRAFSRLLESGSNGRSPFDRKDPYLREYFRHERRLREIYRDLATHREPREIIRLRQNLPTFPALSPRRAASLFFFDPPRPCEICH